MSMSYREMYKRVMLFGNKVKDVIKPFTSQCKEDSKRSSELWHVGSFIVLLGEDVKLMDHSDKPDFIICVDNMKVGVEHTRLIDEQVHKQEKAIDDLIDRAQAIFQKKYPAFNCTVYFSLPEYISYKLSDRNDIAEQIADFVYLRINNTNVQKPSFIEDVDVFLKPGLHFQAHGAYSSGPLLKERVSFAVRKKERLLGGYKKDKNIDEVWLLIVVTGGSGSSDYSFIDSSAFGIDSEFEKVYLLNDFEKKLYKLK